MNKRLSRRAKIGILGGGQLGRMLCEAASPLDLSLQLMDASPHHPAAKIAPAFTCGDITDRRDVLDFGNELDVLSIEIENVHSGALSELKEQGVRIIPDPDILSTIQDKGLQKNWYSEHDFPTAPFVLADSLNGIREKIEEGAISFPVVQKSRTEGYDGRGIQVIESEDELEKKWLDNASMVEKKVDIQKELAVIAVRNASGDLELFPPVEMLFHTESNMLDFLSAPAEVPPSVEKDLTNISKELMLEWDYEGILAIEYFLTVDGDLLINEVAPRPHNSGHHTIEACSTSQFSQHLRALLNWPLGTTNLREKAVMKNLPGAEGHNGPARIQGLPRALKTPDLYVHLYGKQMTRPFRKMGHITTLDESLVNAVTKARYAASMIKITT